MVETWYQVLLRMKVFYHNLQNKRYNIIGYNNALLHTTYQGQRWRRMVESLRSTAGQLDYASRKQENKQFFIGGYRQFVVQCLFPRACSRNLCITREFKIAFHIKRQSSNTSLL